ncbi:alpha/beta hydrolase-fold protein [Cetobacterium sp.]|uniref:alpha/beta hydrolase-fold protein n=1 Tax=Cetobacterium sp. TaxID=2071632 RepID=UPI003F2E0EBC
MRKKQWVCILYFILNLYNIISADGFPKQDYIDFSTDRSTWFFKLVENNKIIFSDFFSPFDPTVKVKHFDPLVSFELENSYYFNKNNNLMVEIEDLKKIYDPYFDYKISKDILEIKYTYYDKKIVQGFGKRSTSIEYTKKTWNIKIDLKKDILKTVGKYSYTEYEPALGGRNKPFDNNVQISKDKGFKNLEFVLNGDAIEIKDNKHYISVSEIMGLTNIKTINENGYAGIQIKNLADVTENIEREEVASKIIIPAASNLWRSGNVEKLDGYTWSDYMDDIIAGKRNYGWKWKGIYIPSGSHFKDADGNEITLEANRIVPYTMYIPKNYSENESRLAYILHGGTGNENASLYRTMERGYNLDVYAEKYNYILVSPNGWTQNPMWMHRQALYSFEKSFDSIIKEYPVDKNKIFIMGNSLGGRGAFDITMRYPKLFKAMVSTAPAWGVKEHSKWEQSRYSVQDIKDLPSLIGIGTLDKTFSFKTEVGNKEELGWLTKNVVPILSNAKYIAVERGNHSQNWGSILDIIFEFFEENLKEEKKESVVDMKFLENKEFVSLRTLKDVLGDKFKYYNINSYDNNPEKAIDYITIIYKNICINLTPGELKYRRNFERYKEDSNERTKDEDKLDFAPKFSKAPYVYGEDIYIPTKDILEILF